MKDTLVLLVLLVVQTSKVCSQPYQADSDGNCRNATSEYRLEGSTLCCKRCRPGERQSKKCSETADSVCEPCKPSQYMRNWNYAPNCLGCTKCKPEKGLQYVQNCSSTTDAKCTCQPGTYCIMGFDDPYCADCRKYRICKVGFGVSVPGTAKSDVKCARCQSGTFSDTASYTEPCRPHTDCDGRAVVRAGDATSDTVCEQQSTTKQPETVFTTASTVKSTVVVTSDSPGSTQSAQPSATEETFKPSTEILPPTTERASGPTMVVVIVIGFLLFFITLLLLFLCRRICSKDSARLHPKVDANGNCESGDKISQNYLGDSQLTSFTVTSPDQQCLLEKREASADHSQCSNNTETLTRTDGYSSHESISPLQSTLALNNLPSALSEPMTLLSNTEPMTLLSNTEPSTPQPTVSTQPSSQPTSPQIISPVATSPHNVNVNITLHIGNGSCGTPSFIPTDLMQADCKLPFGKEEESFSTPQQEDGKQSLMSVQESASYSS